MLEKVKPILLGSLCFSVMITPCYASYEIDTTGLTRVGKSKEELDTYWASYVSQASVTQDFYGLNLIDPTSPEVYDYYYTENGKNSGKLSQTALEDTLHVVNTMRYMAGLNEVGLDWEKNLWAQDAAYVSYLNSSLSHYPSRPSAMNSGSELYASGYYGASTSNLSGGSFRLLGQVIGQMRDDSGSNPYHLGHRRWLLKANTKTIGIGATDQSAAIQVVDSEASYNSEVIAFPSMATYSEMFGEKTPWSLLLGRNFYPAYDDPVVEVKDLTPGKSRIYMTGYGLIINEDYFGDNSALIFGSDLDTSPGKSYIVTIRGLSLDGYYYPIKYGVVFHSAYK